MSDPTFISAPQLFEIISPLFPGLPKHISWMQITLDFDSSAPVKLMAEFFCDIAENGDINSLKQKTVAFELVEKR
jgi:hypothetical protein